MKHIPLFIASLFAAISLQGCATKDREKQSTLNDNRPQSVDCRGIDQEIARTASSIEKSGERGGQPMEAAAVLKTHEGYWMERSVERPANLESITKRMTQLWAIRDAAGCGGSAAAESVSIPVQQPEVLEEHNY